ncbi:hypothetical protein [Bacillus thermotolerans]|uniref:hypothetical protein n=1 Tax=Bacillus thermotolerans TaxID=1221996 RepID=UPI0005834C2E|nr:hypothetical protein [Bacillus thermotolerans]KKB33175.1 hypothetical protein QY97_03825 [Bacillus thermotolerans]
MGKSSKSKRFVEQGKNSVKKHSEQFPFRTTYADAESRYYSTEHTEENPDYTVGGV